MKKMKVKYTYPVSSSEASDSRRKVYDIAARIINNAPLVEKATTPKTKSPDCVGKDQPKRHKSHPSLDVHSAEDRASQQNKGNSSKSELEIHK